MTKFHSPYQFIPVTGKVNGEAVDTTPFEQIKQGEVPHVRHDRWEADSYSGRILCTMRTETPLVLGGHLERRGDKHPALLHPYRDGQAIPGNSLRGMIASVAEAISQSALRVLEPKQYSVRMPMGRAMHGIGVVRVRSDRVYLYPLAVVALKLEHDRLPGKWQQVFHGKTVTLGDCLAGYVLNYKRSDLSNPGLDPRTLSSFNEQHAKRFYRADDLPNLSTLQVGSAIPGDPAAVHMRSPMLFGRQCRNVEPDDQNGSGVLYVTGTDEHGHIREMPNKKHELYIPWANAARHEQKLEITSETLAAFDRVAAERNAAGTLYLPRGYTKTKGRRSGFSEYLSEGDLVYFDVDDEGKQITDIGFSAIWRHPTPGSTYSAFRAAGGTDALPWNGGAWREVERLDESFERQALTPAERLFGVVETGVPKRRSGRNLAGRLRFHDAEAVAPVTLPEEERPLRILASPKPPSPAMYFSPKGERNLPPGRYIRRENLDLEKGEDIPNGRKRYLLPLENDEADQPWFSTHPNEDSQQKLSVRPVPPETLYQFSIDFDNLSAAELGLLLYSLDPRLHQDAEGAGSFRHRLGLAKPLGLGVIEVEVIGVLQIDRSLRYSTQGLGHGRYAKVWSPWTRAMLKDALSDEYAELDGPTTLHPMSEGLWTSAYIDKMSLLSLLSLGRRDRIEHPVRYPFSEPDGQTVQTQEEGYRWFVLNDDPIIREGEQHALGASLGTSIPELDGNWEERKLVEYRVSWLRLRGLPESITKEQMLGWVRSEFGYALRGHPLRLFEWRLLPGPRKTVGVEFLLPRQDAERVKRHYETQPRRFTFDNHPLEIEDA